MNDERTELILAAFNMIGTGLIKATAEESVVISLYVTRNKEIFERPGWDVDWVRN